MNLPAEDSAALAEAVRILEKPGLAPKLMNIIGLPLDKAMAVLPHDWIHVVHAATHKALMAALKLATLTIGEPEKKPASNFLHKLFMAASGAGGGAFGLVSLPVELPFSTCLILRSVADIARSEGEDIRGADQAGLPGGLRLGRGSDERRCCRGGVLCPPRCADPRDFGSGPVHLQAGIRRQRSTYRPLHRHHRGAIRGGRVAKSSRPSRAGDRGRRRGLVNTVFMDHFQNMARGHFTIRRLDAATGRAKSRPRMAKCEQRCRRSRCTTTADV